VSKNNTGSLPLRGILPVTRWRNWSCDGTRPVYVSLQGQMSRSQAEADMEMDRSSSVLSSGIWIYWWL